MRKLSNLSSHTERVWQADWSPSGDLLATCSGDKTVKIWKSNDDPLSGSWECCDTLDSHTKSVRSIAWSHSGELLASASFDGTVVIWQRHHHKFEPMLTLEGHESEVKCVCWNFDDKFLATCGRDKTVWVWETDIDFEYETVAVLSRHTQDIKFVSFHSSKNWLASGAYDNTIIVWVEQDGDWQFSTQLTSHEGTVWSLKWIDDTLLSVSDDLTLKVWDKERDGNYHLQRTVSGIHTRSIYFCDASPVIPAIATCAGDDSIVILGKSDYQPIEIVRSAHLTDVNCVKFHPTLPLLASVSDDKTVSIWIVELSQHIVNE